MELRWAARTTAAAMGLIATAYVAPAANAAAGAGAITDLPVPNPAPLLSWITDGSVGNPLPINATVTTSAAPDPGRSDTSDAVSQVLTTINQARAQAGLRAYTITPGLTRSAVSHTLAMAGGCGLSHQCAGENAPGARETAAAVHWNCSGENIGSGGPVADSSTAIAQMAVSLTQSMLAERPPDDHHRRNILSRSFNHIGIAVYRDRSGTVWLTQDFSD